MTARITQQFVEVLTKSTGVARVTQQFVEVLLRHESGTTFNESTNSSCNITDSAIATMQKNNTEDLGLSHNVVVLADFHQVITSNLGISDSAFNPKDLNQNLTDTLNLVSNAGWENEITVSVESVMDFGDGTQSDRHVSASTTLSLSSQALYFFEREAWNQYSILGITDSVEFEIPGRPYLEQSLGITDSVTVERPYYQRANHYMQFTQEVGYNYGTRMLVASSTISLKGSIPITPSITDTLNLTSEAERRLWPVSDLAFAHTALGAKSKSVSTGALGLTSILNMDADYVRPLTSSLNLTSSVTYFNENAACILKSYHPFLGEGSTVPESLPSEKRDASINRVVLSWPNTDYPSKQVILRAPEIDNTSRYSTTRAYQESMGGSIYVYQNPNWPEYSTLLVTFVALTYTQAVAYQEFIYSTIGHQIELGDWYGNIWRGIITNPEEPIVCDSKRGYTVSFQFEGVQQVDHLRTSSVNLTDTVDFEIVYGLFDALALTQTVGYNVDRVIESTDALGLTDVSIGSTS